MYASSPAGLSHQTVATSMKDARKFSLFITCQREGVIAAACECKVVLYFVSTDGVPHSHSCSSA